MTWGERISNRSFTRADARDVMGDDGRDVLVVVAKLAYRFDARGKLRVIGRPVREFDVKEIGGGLRYPGDFTLPFRGTDCLVVGTAHPGPIPVESKVISMSVGPVRKSIRLFGPRVYMKTPRGVGPGPSANVVTTPLRYEFAYGGREPGRIESEPTNPLGRGFALEPERLVGQEAHRLEQAGAIGVPPGGACFAPIDVDWSPRRELMGTYSDEWRRKRRPAAPADRDPHFHSCARPEQRSPTALTLPFKVELRNFVGEDTTELDLPAYGIEVLSELAGEMPKDHQASISRVLVDVDERVIEISFTSHIPLPMKWEKLKQVSVLGTSSLPDEVKHVIEARK